MNWFTNLENTLAKDEQWVVTQITNGWNALQAGEKALETDVLGIFSWINTNQSSILAVFKTALVDLSAIGAFVPQTAPIVATATTAIDAATAAIDALASGIQKGTTPISTLTNAYHAVKTAQSAVAVVLKAKTAAPTVAPTAPTPVAPGSA
jgi:hypothetical protein